MKPLPTLGNMTVRDTEYIGCCGFPWPTGGKQAVYDHTYIVQLDQLSGSAAASSDEMEPTPETLGRQLDSKVADDSNWNSTDTSPSAFTSPLAGSSLEEILVLVGNGGSASSGDGCCSGAGDPAPKHSQHVKHLQQQQQHGWHATTVATDAPASTGHSSGGSSSSAALAWDEPGRLDTSRFNKEGGARCGTRESCPSAGHTPVQQPRDHTPESEDTPMARGNMQGIGRRRSPAASPGSPVSASASRSASRRAPTASDAGTPPAGLRAFGSPPRRRQPAAFAVEPCCTAGGYEFGGNMAHCGPRSWQVGSCLSMCTVGCPQPVRRGWGEQFDDNSLS